MSFGITAAGVTAAAAAVGAGATVYGATQAGGDAPAPIVSDPGKALLKYLKGLEKGLPQLADMEGQYRPQFGQLNIADQQQYLNALLGMGGQAAGSSQQQIDAARSGEFGSMAGNTGTVMGILGGIDPQGQRLAQQAGQMGISQMNAAQGLDMQERRMADQTARESFGARGRLNDNSSVAAEILGRTEVLDEKKRRAMGMAQNAMGMTQGFSNPALSILMGNARVNYARVEQKMPRVFLRAHRHVGGYYSDGNAAIVATGAFQLLTRWATKVVGESICRPAFAILDWRNRPKNSVPAITLPTYAPQQPKIRS
jgi:hypothetical protein